jgi:hypothetical protein
MYSLSSGPLPLHTRHRATESELKIVFKPKAVVHAGAFMWTGPREEEEGMF